MSLKKVFDNITSRRREDYVPPRELVEDVYRYLEQHFRGSVAAKKEVLKRPRKMERPMVSSDAGFGVIHGDIDADEGDRPLKECARPVARPAKEAEASFAAEAGAAAEADAASSKTEELAAPLDVAVPQVFEDAAHFESLHELNKPDVLAGAHAAGTWPELEEEALHEARKDSKPWQELKEEALHEAPKDSAPWPELRKEALKPLYENRRPLSYAAGSAQPISGLHAMSSDDDLTDLLKRQGESFQQMLLRLIDERHFTDVEVYKRANMDRKLFSKIRSNSEYQPTKKTALALALALKLDLEDTMDLLGRAGLALSPSSRFDLIVEYCIRHSIYDMFEVNALLYEYDEPALG